MPHIHYHLTGLIIPSGTAQGGTGFHGTAEAANTKIEAGITMEARILVLLLARGRLILNRTYVRKLLKDSTLLMLFLLFSGHCNLQPTH